jgi:hypothetical protein
MSKSPPYLRQNRILDKVSSDITGVPSSYEEGKILKFRMSKQLRYVRQNRMIKVVQYDETFMMSSYEDGNIRHFVCRNASVT